MANVLSLSRAAGALRGGVDGSLSAVDAFSLFSSFERLAAALTFEASESIIYRYSREREKSRDRARAGPYERRDRAETALRGVFVALAESCQKRDLRVGGTLQINMIDPCGAPITQVFMFAGSEWRHTE